MVVASDAPDATSERAPSFVGSSTSPFVPGAGSGASGQSAADPTSLMRRRTVGSVDATLEAAIADTAPASRPGHPMTTPPTASAPRLGVPPIGARRLSQSSAAGDAGSPIGEGVPPAGYTLRHVSGDDEIAARVEIHRAAFAPSQMTGEKYTRLTTLPHYRFEDDLVVEAPDGALAAFAMAWWDPAARVGEFEPVGTHPDHQRRGLGRALLSHGLRRYRDLGADLVQIYSMSDNGASEGLYQAVGFERRRYRLPLRSTAGRGALDRRRPGPPRAARRSTRSRRSLRLCAPAPRSRVTSASACSCVSATYSAS